jgi:hypothetical protein
VSDSIFPHIQYYTEVNAVKTLQSTVFPPFIRPSILQCKVAFLEGLAFGSLIIAIVKMIRVLLEYIDNKLKHTENPVAKFLIK